MLRIEKLFGVIHGIDGTSCTPSRKMLSELDDLQEGDRVGVEFFPPPYQDLLDVDGKSIPIDLESRNYWKALIDECTKRKLDIQYLDDLDITRGYFRLRLRQESYRNSPGDSYNRYGAEAQKVQVFDREEKFLENILRLKPKYVFLGTGHTDSIFFGNNNPISFEHYIREDAKRTDTYPIIETTHNPDSPNIDIANKRESIARTARAFELGRIFPDGEPDFIGTWCTELPPEGLFELYITERNGSAISGQIEDVLGTAKFTGSKNIGSIEFSKTYIKEASSSEALRGNIQFACLQDGTKYIGSYNASGYTIPFWMRSYREFTPSHITGRLF